MPVTRGLYESAFFPFIFHSQFIGANFTATHSLENSLCGVCSTSFINCSIYSALIHVAPSLTSISDAVRGFGIAFLRYSTLSEYDASPCNAFSAEISFFLMFPERYSSEVCQVPDSGTLKIMPLRSLIISSRLFPVSPSIYSRSTAAFSPIETDSASTDVSTCVTGTAFLMVLLVNMSALPATFPSSSVSSSDDIRL